MGFLSTLVVSTIQFVVMAGLVVGAVVLGAKLRASKDAKKAEDEK